MSKAVNTVLAGVPHTGKTTYLALLYLAIVRSEHAQIQLGGFKDDREYLNEISGRLQRCEQAGHTEVGRQSGLKLSVVLPDGSDAVLEAPDLSGETWEEALVERTWSLDLDTKVQQASGLCLFIHAGEFQIDPTIAEIEVAASALAEEIESMEADNAEHFEPNRLATQVCIVDLIQLVCEERGRRPANVSIIVSAFDLLPIGSEPSSWLSLNAPLVDQYLDSNKDWLNVEVFGLSAQGGRFDDPADRALLLEADPLHRASLTRGDGSPVDFDMPVLWAIGHA